MEGGFLDQKPLLEEGCSGHRGAGESTAAVAAATTTPAVIFSTLVAVCASFGYGCALSYSSPAQAGIMEDLGLSVADCSMFGSVMTFGGMIGALFCGRIASILGRKQTMWLSQLLCTIGWLAIAFAPNGWWLDMGRLSIGFGVGFVSYVIPVYVAEITPKESRGAFSYTNQSTLDTLQENTEAKMADLFQKKYAYSLIVGFGLMILQQLGGLTGVAYYAGDVVEKAGFPTSTGTIIFSLIQVPAAAGGLFFMDIVGRRPLLMVSGGGMCLSCFLVGLSFLLQGLNLLGNLTPVMTVLGLTVYIAASSIGWAGIPWIIMSEIFPMSVKALAGSFVT